MISFKKKISALIKKFKEYDKIADISKIGRRAFANNSFDGILTIMGVILGSYFAGTDNARTIVLTGIGACIAMGVSGSWGSYFTEKAERKKAMLDLEKATLRKLNNTKIEKAANVATITITAIDGLSPFIGAFIVLMPFFFVNGHSLIYAYAISIFLAFFLLGLLGAFLGKLSKENIWLNSFRMVIAGFICIGLSMILQHI